MKKERILINLSLGFGLAEMGFESCLTREDVSFDHPDHNRLPNRDYCMLSRARLLSDRLLAQYSLRL